MQQSAPSPSLPLTDTTQAINAFLPINSNPYMTTRDVRMWGCPSQDGSSNCESDNFRKYYAEGAADQGTTSGRSDTGSKFTRQPISRLSAVRRAFAQAHQCVVHLDHGESVALAIGEELASEVGYLLGKRNSAGGEPQERA